MLAIPARCVVLSQGDEVSGDVFILEGNTVPVPGGKGEANFVMKFDGGSSCSVNLVSKVDEIDADDCRDSEVTVCQLECRGCDVVSWRYAKSHSAFTSQSLNYSNH